MKKSLVLSLVWILFNSVQGFALPPLTLSDHQKLVTILSTNDIHGGVVASRLKDGSIAGGMAEVAGGFNAIRSGLSAQFGATRAGVVLVDAGDQFQGTLISNFNEGQLVFSAMNQTGYDAVVPGNHDYDFGPIGWLDDQVTPNTIDQDSRSALKRLVKMAHFPLLSANTYLRATLQGVDGKPIAVTSHGCTPTDSSNLVVWSQAQRPDFLQPYTVVSTAGGVRVALIGIDHVDTSTLTTAQNVSDFCFRNEVDTYLEIRSALTGQADVFVMIIHNGNPAAQSIVAQIAAHGPNLLHAVVAGHTHRVEKTIVSNIPIIQSGANGQLFGRIDLVVDTDTHHVLQGSDRVWAGVPLQLHACSLQIQGFCAVPSDQRTHYEDQAIIPDATIQGLIASAQNDIAPISSRVLGSATGIVETNRISESPLADALTDALLQISGADVALINTGGMRAPVGPGYFNYQDLFKVLPFNNHAVLLDPVPMATILKLLTVSIQTCGDYGALMQSGLRVRFTRHCIAGPNGATPSDLTAQLTHVESASGEVLLDTAQGITPNLNRKFKLVTLDFLATGGAGYTDLGGLPQTADLGIFRERLTSLYLKHPAQFVNQVDGRWVEQSPAI